MEETEYGTNRISSGEDVPRERVTRSTLGSRRQSHGEHRVESQGGWLLGAEVMACIESTLGRNGIEVAVLRLC